MVRFGRKSITELTPTLIEERGEIVEDWGTPIRRTIRGCSVQPGEGDRDFERADSVTADYTVFMPARTVVDQRARYELPTTTGQFLSLGPPEVWDTGLTTDHVRLRLRRRDG